MFACCSILVPDYECFRYIQACNYIAFDRLCSCFCGRKLHFTSCCMLSAVIKVTEKDVANLVWTYFIHERTSQRIGQSKKSYVLPSPCCLIHWDVLHIIEICSGITVPSCAKRNATCLERGSFYLIAYSDHSSNSGNECEFIEPNIEESQLCKGYLFYVCDTVCTLFLACTQECDLFGDRTSRLVEVTHQNGGWPWCHNTQPHEETEWWGKCLLLSAEHWQVSMEQMFPSVCRTLASKYGVNVSFYVQNIGKWGWSKCVLLCAEHGQVSME